MNATPFTYLALGDSYTIGESVGLTGNFPYQTVRMLRERGVQVTAPEIVATTGWTTEELMAAIRQHLFLPQYDLVSLLIGVNNQYRGQSLEDYIKNFSKLLQQAIVFAGGRKKNVVVLSIPDYGAMPFAQNKNREKITKEIEAFNAAAQCICREADIAFIDITSSSRHVSKDSTLIAADGLHPSAKEYSRWAEKIADWASSVLQIR